MSQSAYLYNVFTVDRAVSELCKANGISKDKFASQSDSIHKIEMFMHHSYKQITGLHYFTNLQTLRLINIGLEKIEGLESLSNLTGLWLNENRLSKIEGLEKLVKLKELHLYGNMITKIEGLSTLGNLERLSLFDNLITELTGLEDLITLQCLCVAKNRIDTIDAKWFSNNHCLRELNVAGNLIGVFKDVKHLDSIQSLESLNLKCSNFGENPVCSLCNYQTYALYHLPRIKKLDSLFVTEEARQIADATFMKKKMYYNMRIKTLRRNSRNVIARAKELISQQNTDTQLTLNILFRTQKELERERDESEALKQYSNLTEREDGRRDGSFVPIDRINRKLRAITDEVKKRMEQLNNVHFYLNEFIEKVNATTEMNISKLLLELETGGNIRLEEGQRGDIWFDSCVDLVRSRFFASDFLTYGYNEIKVTKVTRIHNRYLRNRFENRLDEVVDTSDSSYKRSFEYLFFSNGIDSSLDIEQIIQDGFPKTQQYSERGCHSAITLSNSISLCELSNVQTSPIPVLDGKRTLLIAKVFLGHYRAEKKPNFGVQALSDIQQSCSLIKLQDYPNIDSVYRTKVNDSKQRTWFLFDNRLILPEYVVEFEFVNSSNTDMSLERDTIFKHIHTTNDIDKIDIQSHSHHFCNFLTNLEMSKLDEHTMHLTLSMDPTINPRKKIAMISKYTIAQLCLTTSFSSIVYLNLFGNSIRKIEALEGLIHMKTLILSFNEIEKIEGLETCVNLEVLHLDYNMIKKVEGLQGLSRLKVLYLNNNLVYRVEDILALNSRTLIDIEELSLNNNAICDVPSYRYIVIRRLNHLRILDGKAIADEERVFANTQLHVISDDLVRQSTVKRDQCIEDHTTLVDSVQEVDLRGKRLRRITNLERYVNIKRLNLSNNEICRIEHLQELVSLQELNLEENLISKIEGLSSSQHLRNLELGYNRISRVENLDICTKLIQLSLESNLIDSLSGLSKLVNLMELYLANNRVHQLQEILYLKPLAKLIILDLSGNPICSQNQYRLHSIFHLKRLKVLDGVSVDSQEVQQAREEFTGKITTDVLREVTGGSEDYGAVLALNLNNTSLRDLSNTTGPLFDKFTMLLELYLQNNLINTLNGLQSITSTLKVLRLDKNKLGETCNSNPMGFTIGRYFEKLVNLEELSLEENHLSNMTCLSLGKLKRLKVLILSRNDITKIEGLQGCTTLQELYLDKNRIRFLDHQPSSAVCELDYIPNLRLLHIEENGLRSLDGIQYFGNLSVLYCACNRVTDASEIERLAELCRQAELTELSLAFNPISRKSIYRPTIIYHCPSLYILDGREILSDERHRANMFLNQDFSGSTPANIFTAPGSAPNSLLNQQPDQGSLIPTQWTGGPTTNARHPIRVAAMQFEQSSTNTNTGNNIPAAPTPSETSYLTNAGSSVNREVEKFSRTASSRRSNRIGSATPSSMHPIIVQPIQTPTTIGSFRSSGRSTINVVHSNKIKSMRKNPITQPSSHHFATSVAITNYNPISSPRSGTHSFPRVQ